MEVRALKTKLRTLVLLLAGSTVGFGCVGSEDDTGAGRAGLIETDRCEIFGQGSLAPGDLLGGDVAGGDLGARGQWSHQLPTGATLELDDPTDIYCRINGRRLGDLEGAATLNGVGGYTYQIEVEDRGDMLSATTTRGVPILHTVTASRTYRPTEWQDGSLDVEGSAEVVIPEELAVSVGNAGNQWAWLTFQRSDTGDEVRCRYRGGASCPVPSDSEDVAAGESYVFHDCGDSGVTAGDIVDVDWLDVHVHTGAHSLPSRDGAITVVDATIAVIVDTEVPTEPDRYTLVLRDANEQRVLTRGGELADGDLTVILIE